MGWTAGVGSRQATKAKQEEGASRELLLPYAVVEHASIVKILLPAACYFAGATAAGPSEDDADYVHCVLPASEDEADVPPV